MKPTKKQRIPKTQTPEYKAWEHMRWKCKTKRGKAFRTYGARGIVVCKRWQESFEDFLADVGRRPSDRHSIDRIDNDGNYEPGNVRWATPLQQVNNRTVTLMVTYKGIRQPFADAWRMAGRVCRYQVAYHRYKANWAVDAAVETPKLEQGFERARRPGGKSKRSAAYRPAALQSLESERGE
jgi:hypothetical protein